MPRHIKIAALKGEQDEADARTRATVEAIIADVRARCGPPDLALIPIGAYEPRWFMAPMHMNPAEAVAWHQASGARRSLAMHWGTFQLSDEGRDDPIKALAAARASNGIAAEDFSVVAPGESVVV